MRQVTSPKEHLLTAEEREFYCRTLAAFEQARIEVLVGGAYAFARYTGIERHTKDLDLFVRRADFQKALMALARAGYETHVPFPHWLGKAYCGEFFVDVIYSSGNGLATVDDEWFLHAQRDAVFDVPVRLCPREEMIWSKSFIQERERFDGADVAHLLLRCAESLDWRRLLRRFGADWRVLLAHLVLFGYIFPSERQRVPDWVMDEFLRRLATSNCAAPIQDRLCRGTLLSRQQYLMAVEQWGFVDPRTRPENPMTNDDIATWTAGIAHDGSQQS